MRGFKRFSGAQADAVPQLVRPVPARCRGGGLIFRHAAAALCLYSIGLGEIQTARELAGQLYRMAESLQDPALLVEAHQAMANVGWAAGDFELGRVSAADVADPGNTAATR